VETANIVKQQLIDTWTGFLEVVIGSAPKVISIVVLMVIALVVAKVVERVLKSMLSRMRFDQLLGKVGLDEALGRIGVRQSLSSVVPRIVYFLLLFLFARGLGDAMGLTVISDAMGSFLAYMPNVVAAVLVVLFGSAVGQFAGGAVANAADGAGLDFGRSLGNLVSGGVLFIAVIMAIGQLKIDTDVVRLVTACSLGGMALAFGLSFGLGSRDILRHVLSGYYVRKVLAPGSMVEIDGQRGELRAITPTLTLLDTEQGTVAVANSRFLEETSLQGPAT
jgi:hypothetical protein